MTETKQAPKMGRQQQAAIMKVVEERFKILQRDFDARRDRLAREIRDRMQAEAKERCQQAAEGMQPLVEEARELMGRVERLGQHFERELGVFPGEYQEHTVWTDRSMTKSERRITGHARKAVSLEIWNNWAPRDVEGAIEAELSKLADERASGGRSLDQLRLDLLEELLTAGLDADAKAFLDKVPKLDDLLPPRLPEADSKQLQSGGKRARKR